MTFSRLTNRIISTPNQSSRNGRPVVEFIIHHMATVTPGGSYVETLMRTGSKQVSATYIIRNSGELVGVVPEEHRPWSVSNSDWDGHAISVEIENETGAPGWTISAAARKTLTELIADVATRYNFPINRTTVRGHREGSGLGHGGSYATACPGGVPLDTVVYEALVVQAGEPEPEPEPIKEQESNMAQRTYYARVDANGADTGEWMLAGVDIPAHPTDPKQDGYRITIDKEVAKVWARQYSFAPVETKAVQLTRDLYIKQQEFARRDAAEWRAGIRALLKG